MSGDSSDTSSGASTETIAEITTSVRGIAVEVELDHERVGLDRSSVVNCHGIHTIEQRVLAGPLGVVDDDTMRQVCSAITYAFGW